MAESHVRPVICLAPLWCPPQKLRRAQRKSHNNHQPQAACSSTPPPASERTRQLQHLQLAELSLISMGRVVRTASSLVARASSKWILVIVQANLTILCFEYIIVLLPSCHCFPSFLFLYTPSSSIVNSHQSRIIISSVSSLSTLTTSRLSPIPSLFDL